MTSPVVRIPLIKQYFLYCWINEYRQGQGPNLGSRRINCWINVSNWKRKVTHTHELCTWMSVLSLPYSVVVIFT